jgi:hypothetical protein
MGRQEARALRTILETGKPALGSQNVASIFICRKKSGWKFSLKSRATQTAGYSRGRRYEFWGEIVTLPPKADGNSK